MKSFWTLSSFTMLPVLIYQMFMVLPNSPTFIPAMGSQFSPPKLQVNYRSYAQASKVSLMHQHFIPPHVDDDSKLNTLQTSIFRTSRTKGTFCLMLLLVKKSTLTNSAWLFSKNNTLIFMPVFLWMMDHVVILKFTLLLRMTIMTSSIKISSTRPT